MFMRARLGAIASIALFFVPVSAGDGGIPTAEPPEAKGGRAAAEPARLTPAVEPPDNAFPVAGRVGWGEAGAQFGASRGGRSHEGQDLFAPAGTPLRAVADGRVIETGNNGGRGNYVAIWDAEARRTYVYLHLREPAPVRPGERVRAGERVGSVGCTGSCWGDHLHFEVRRGKSLAGPALDPAPLLRRWSRAA